MGEAKERRTKELARYEAKVSTIGVVIGGVVTAMLGAVGSCVGYYWVQVSDISKSCDKLEVENKSLNEKLADQRTTVAELRQTVHAKDALLAAKDTQLLIKDSESKYFQSKYYEREGRMITREDTEIAKVIGGTTRERVGIDDRMTSFEKIEKTWKTPLLMGMRPGVFLPAPDDIVQPYLDMVGEYDAGNYTNAVRLAERIFKQIKDPIDATDAHIVNIDIRFGLLASEVCRILAEGELVRRNYERAAVLMQKAAGIVGNKPPAKLLALESAMFYRAGFSYGYFTKHMAAAIENSKDEAYKKEIHRELAKLGYLQRYYPNKDGTGIGDEIDWSHLGIAKSDMPPIEKRNGEIWSRRWAGFGKYEAYNLSEEFSRAVKSSGAKGLKSTKSVCAAPARMAAG